MSVATLAPLRLQAVVDSPLGPVLFALSGDALAGLWFRGQRHAPGTLDVPRNDADPVARRVAQALDAYWEGEFNPLWTVPVALAGTPFQQRVWRALESIPVGRTTTYGAIARDLEAPAAVRAVGAAVGRNPVSLRVPCHRVVGHDGGLTGYAGGLALKERLLRIEGALPRGLW